MRWGWWGGGEGQGGGGVVREDGDDGRAEERAENKRLSETYRRRGYSPYNVQQDYYFFLVWCGGCGGPSTAAPHDLPPIDACVNATALSQ